MSLKFNGVAVRAFLREKEKISSALEYIGRKAATSIDDLSSAKKALGPRRFLPFSQERASWKALKNNHSRTMSQLDSDLAFQRNAMHSRFKSPDADVRRAGSKGLESLKGYRSAAGAAEDFRIQDSARKAQEAADAKARSNRRGAILRNAAYGTLGTAGLVGGAAIYNAMPQNSGY